MISEATITEFFLQYAYSPSTVYFGVIVFMTMSSFGLPIPEEIILVSCGFIAFMALHPSIYPPPSPEATGVNLVTLSIVCFLAVLLSDMVIYWLGKYFGPKIFATKFFKRTVKEKHLERVNKWYKKYGAWVCGVFRFTPGLRFPGHMSCGMMGVKWWKFLAVDGTAALVSVPTQVVFVAFYGKEILTYFKQFKLVLGGLIILFVAYKIITKYRNREPKEKTL